MPGRIKRSFRGNATYIDKSQSNRGTQVVRFLLLSLLLFLSSPIGCGVHEPGQRDWRLDPTNLQNDNKDASSNDAEGFDAETDTTDTEDGNRADTNADARSTNAEDDSCTASDEVCDGEDNDCDGEIDGQKASENCELDNAFAVCEAGRCVVSRCEGSYKNCDQEDSNGCESLLKEIENCGECGLTCEIENATADCSSGICELDECEHQFADCNNDPEDGCETSLNSTKHCGECDNTCPEPEIGSGSSYVCEDNECKLIDCESGLANCDDDPETSCDTDIFKSFENCGSCGRVCNSRTADRCIDGECSCGERGGPCRLATSCCEDGICRLCQN